MRVRPNRPYSACGSSGRRSRTHKEFARKRETPRGTKQTTTQSRNDGTTDPADGSRAAEGRPAVGGWAPTARRLRVSAKPPAGQDNDGERRNDGQPNPPAPRAPGDRPKGGGSGRAGHAAAGGNHSETATNRRTYRVIMREAQKERSEEC